MAKPLEARAAARKNKRIVRIGTGDEVSKRP